MFVSLAQILDLIELVVCGLLFGVALALLPHSALQTAILIGAALCVGLAVRDLVTPPAAHELMISIVVAPLPALPDIPWYASSTLAFS